jgi:putative hydrolase of the HAD superfamily
VKSFSHVNVWVFDLDNTLYPASCRLFDQMHVRMGEYVSQLLGVSLEEAKRVQKDMYYKYGTTLRGLMIEHNHAPEGFLDYVHDIDYAPVTADPLLLQGLEKLPGRKLVFTNGTTGHARRVMDRLGISDAFHGIFDIVDSDHIPKPSRDPYEKFLAAHDVEAANAAMFEDIARNLEVPHDLGMTTVLVTSTENPDAQHLNAGGIGEHVHYTTANLGEFLNTIATRDAA